MVLLSDTVNCSCSLNPHITLITVQVMDFMVIIIGHDEAILVMTNNEFSVDDVTQDLKLMSYLKMGF